ncbi:MAG: hypothetical protein DMG22_09505 [Acidobacteria bacterium]|nr:MAG: hypothetical protein DMG22_09505 [Acidobacteriota bacterium]
MNATQGPFKEEKGLSTHQLILMFLAAVAVCAVFFAAGFLVGYNERSSKSAPVAERVSPSSSVIPPVVNPAPAERSSQGKEATVTEGTPIRESAEPLPNTFLPPMKPAEKPARATEKLAPAQTRARERQGYTIQVAASGTHASAEKVVASLKAEGFPALLAPLRGARGRARRYRVRVGPYRTREEAEKVRDKLAQAGFKRPFIKH